MNKAATCALPALLAGCIPIPKKTRVREKMPSPSGEQASPVPARTLAVDDVVRFTTKTGKTYIFRVYKVDETSFHGVAKNGKSYRVPCTALNSLAVRRDKTGVDWVLVPAGLHGLGGLGSISLAGGGGGGGMSFGLLCVLMGAFAWRRPRAVASLR